MSEPTSGISPDKQRALLFLEQILQDHISPILADNALVTLYARVPGNEGADVVITSEDPKNYRKLVRGLHERLRSANKRAMLGDAHG